MATSFPTVESAGWISEQQCHGLLVQMARELVEPALLHARFRISNIGELQSEDFAEALVFIGKNSKEKERC